MVRKALIRLAFVLAPRAGINMAVAGGAIGYGSHFVDLRGKLPERQDIHYSVRNVNTIQGVVLHHSATKGQTISSMAQFHTEVRGWPGLAYHFAIGWDGTVYQCHDLSTISYHSAGYNQRTLGIVLIGNYQDRQMTEEMKGSLVELTSYLHDQYDLKYMWLHRDTKSTACPGQYAVEFARPLQWGPPPPSKK